MLRERRFAQRLKATAQYLHGSVRSLSEACVLSLAFVCADPTMASLGMGFSLATSGELLRIWSAGYGYRKGQVSFRGPYRFLRYPYYLGSILLLLGFCVAARNPYVLVAAAALLAVVYHREVRSDDLRLAAFLGPKFAEYRARVPAFLPQIWPAPLVEGDTAEFSWRLAVLLGRKRELDALVGLAAGFSFFYALSRLPDKAWFRLGLILCIGFFAVFRILYYRKTRTQVLAL